MEDSYGVYNTGFLQGGQPVAGAQGWEGELSLHVSRRGSQVGFIAKKRLTGLQMATLAHLLFIAGKEFNLVTEVKKGHHI